MNRISHLKLALGSDECHWTLQMISQYCFRSWLGALRHHVAWWPWRRHQMETFSALLAICAGNSPVPGEFPAQRPVTRSFDVFFDLRLNKRLSKQSWGWWFESLSRPLWRHRNDTTPLPDTVVLPYGITRPQWIKTLCPGDAIYMESET